MEVHPPHEPVHTWREALIHIGLMTVGLFIALMLEGFVEYLHHKELVHQARENIRRELQDNHRAAQQDIQSLKENAARVKAGLDTLSLLRADPNLKGQSIEFTMTFSTLSDAAFRTARDTGAFGYMSYDEVQRYAGVYGTHQDLSTRAATILTHEAETLAPILAAKEHFENIPPAQYDEMMRSTAANYEDVLLLGQMLQDLDQEYADELKQS